MTRKWGQMRRPEPDRPARLSSGCGGAKRRDRLPPRRSARKRSHRNHPMRLKTGMTCSQPELLKTVPGRQPVPVSAVPRRPGQVVQRQWDGRVERLVEPLPPGLVLAWLGASEVRQLPESVPVRVAPRETRPSSWHRRIGRLPANRGLFEIPSMHSSSACPNCHQACPVCNPDPSAPSERPAMNAADPAPELGLRPR